MTEPGTPRLTFWLELASTYTYLSAMRIEALAQAAGVAVDWQPFLLGPIFKAQGWSTSPFNIYPAKGRYMSRDVERRAASRGLVFHMPDPFPQNSLFAARIATVAATHGWLPPFAKAVLAAQFAHRLDVSRPDVLSPLIARLGFDPADVFAEAESDDTKARLRAATARALQLGIFGSPSFVAEDGELFWGDDRLEPALSWVTARMNEH